ncbi:MAG TPA: RluA family pseudouridine synthase [Gemmatimonadales bacterium]|jgi:23S rRNA pseudouridine1911/1915/1917 synthase|nr:RluA family pseudouridine synthase [Gemmatimonadales bacterium]
MPDLRRFAVTAAATERLDRFLADQLSLSRTHAARLVAEKRVQVNGAVARASRVLERGDEVTVEIPDVEPPRHLVPADIPLQVVWEDEHLAVIDKPAGLVVHPAPGHWDDTLVNALMARGTQLGGGVAGRPGIVHRLDRDTSGLMVVAKTDLAHRRLGHALAERRVSRRYAALAWGHFDADPTVIEAPIDRHPKDRTRMAVHEGGRAARTDVHVVARFAVCDLVRCVLHSGRTHQIRVHLAHVGHPVVGDPVYGAGGSRRIGGPLHAAAEALERATPRQALHAAELGFRHPVTGAPLRFRSDWPADLRETLRLAAGAGAEVADRQGLGYLGFFKDDG